jgi:predicted amidophosphoribosyltransferase
MIENKETAFEQAQEGRQAGIIKEFILFLKHNKKYWMIPILITLLALAVLILLGGTAVAPFIYTLF